MDRAHTLRVAIAQIAPVPLDRTRTTQRVVSSVREAAGAGAGLVAFGETFLPGYPFWLSRVDGARFDEPEVKSLHARYLAEGVDIERGDLGPICEAAREGRVAVVLGIAERPRDRGGHTLYASAVTISPSGEIASVHRKLMPTYEERLAWGAGDAHGLRSHRFLEPFTLGSLNCWENWMPLPRAAMWAQGVDLHVALWPGNLVNTQDCTRFIAREGRSYVISASTRLTGDDLPIEFPLRDRILSSDQTPSSGMIHDGGSAIAGPDGEWVVEPNTSGERLILADLDFDRILEERQSFDPSGHYGRPELLHLEVDRTRMRSARFSDA